MQDIDPEALTFALGYIVFIVGMIIIVIEDFKPRKKK